MLGVSTGQARVGFARLLLFALVAVAAVGPASPARAEEWVQNFVPTELWSGAGPGAVSFGTAPRWDYFRTIAPVGGRLYVLVARTNSMAYIDATAVGPSGPPPVGWPNATTPVAAPSGAGVAARPAVPPAPASGVTTQPAIGPIPGYSLYAEVALWPALQALNSIRHTWTLQALSSTGTRLRFGDLPYEAAGMYEPAEAIITINVRWARSDPRALAAIIEHEGKHVADVLSGLDVYSPQGCLTTEINAFYEEAKTWGELVGPRGKLDPRDELERSLNYKLSLLERGPDAIRNLILQNPGYRMQCQLRG